MVIQRSQEYSLLWINREQKNTVIQGYTENTRIQLLKVLQRTQGYSYSEVLREHKYTGSILHKYLIYYFEKPNFYRNTNLWQIYCLCFEGVTDENIGRYPWQCLNKDTPLSTLLSFCVTLFYSDGKQSGERIEVSGVRFQASLGPKYIGDKTNHSFRTLTSDTYYKPVDLQTYVIYLYFSRPIYLQFSSSTK